MRHILVVEGNSEALVQIDGDKINGAAEHYAACLNTLGDDLRFSITRPHFEVDPAPEPDWDDVDGVIFTGAGVNWSAADDAAAPVRRVMEKALATGKPVFGSCYGLQVGVAVIGGEVGANPNGPELAVARDINVLDKEHPLYEGKASCFDALCMHRDDVFSVDPSLDILSANEHTKIQAVASREASFTFWGVQYHPEFTYDSVVGCIARNDVRGFSQLAPLKRSLGVEVDHVDDVISDFTKLARGQDTPQLEAQYQLNETITDPAQHRTELKNWLGLVTAKA